ncbi:MAG: 1-deoxy-D-xylulose-5-phosphate reductoisomerase, partial [Candidatus Eremiobacteraeota bacterium]|nr:1-deoxy-D-xylulose-5-phosphate reductoisomerase [Candidatus Eremiobacteraeota bacterium]
IANKELIVAAGDLLMRTARKGGTQVIPVDSEHSAIFQCLVGEDRNAVERIVLTASGGPFWRKSAAELESVTLEEALAHPTWHMGVKNTIDSATLMNKGLEVIEAAQLFEIAPERVHIVVHPQSIAHGAVIFSDGNVKMQVAAPDMHLPIGYALSYPERLRGAFEFDGALAALGDRDEQKHLRYEFEPPDEERFPCVALAYRAAKLGGTAPAVLSAANEIAVAAFVKGEIGFCAIPRVIEKALSAVSPSDVSPQTVHAADGLAREAARAAIQEHFEEIEV